MNSPLVFLKPEWPAPAHIQAFTTLRVGGVSTGGFSSLNLATHVQDNPDDVAENRRRLRQYLPNDPVWLRQVHGTQVITLPHAGEPEADGVIAHDPLQICAILTADCLPVLFCDQSGQTVAGAHAGWRGLSQGVLETTLAHMNVPLHTVLAWLGPAIGPQAFEVGDEVRTAFLTQAPEDVAAFQPGLKPGKWYADLYALARLRLKRSGVQHIYGGTYCTWQDETRFFSFRRHPQCGRFASLIWRTA